MPSELFYKRVKNIVDASSFREPEKVPVGLDYLNWPYGYAGKTLEQLVNDPEANAAAYCSFMEEIPFDFTMNPGFYEPYDMFQALGSDNYTLCADRCTVQHNQAANKFISEEEYDRLIADPDYFINEYFLKRNVPAFQKSRSKAYEMLKNAAKCVARCVKTTELIADKAIHQYDIVPISRVGLDKKGRNEEEIRLFGSRFPFFLSSLDSLFDIYRGMMGVFEDLFEMPEILDQACDAITAYQASQLPPSESALESSPLPMGFGLYHVAPYLSPEDYDKYWFQPFKKMMLPYAEAGKKIYIKGESSFLHTIERFKEFPKGSVVIQLDSDDPFEAHKKIGGYQTLATGIRTAMLSLNDLQNCKDYIKKSFDTFAPGGGFLFYQDKPFLSPSDADPAKVKEIWEFANECAEGHY